MLKLYGCNPAPQVVALVLDEGESLTAGTVLEEDDVAADEVIESEDAGALVMPVLWVPELATDPLDVAEPLVWLAETESVVEAPLDAAEPTVWLTEAEPAVEPLRADDTSELRLESSAEFVTVLTGTNDELTTDTLLITDCEAELEGFEVALLGETKLRLVVGVVEVVFMMASGFVEVLQNLLDIEKLTTCKSISLLTQSQP